MCDTSITNKVGTTGKIDSTVTLDGVVVEEDVVFDNYKHSEIIDVLEDGCFNLSVPYDKGFNIYLDSKKINYERTNISFIGFKINKGKHKIEIEYKAPYKKEASIISLIGLVLYILYLIKDRRKENGNIKSRKFN